MVDKVAASTIPCCVCGHHVYQHTGLHLLERSLLPSFRDPYNTSGRFAMYIIFNAAQCVAPVLRAIPRVIFLILHHFLISWQKMYASVLI